MSGGCIKRRDTRSDSKRLQFCAFFFIMINMEISPLKFRRVVRAILLLLCILVRPIVWVFPSRGHTIKSICHVARRLIVAFIYKREAAAAASAVKGLATLPIPCRSRTAVFDGHQADTWGRDRDTFASVFVTVNKKRSTGKYMTRGGRLGSVLRQHL